MNNSFYPSSQPITECTQAITILFQNGKVIFDHDYHLPSDIPEVRINQYFIGKTAETAYSCATLPDEFTCPPHWQAIPLRNTFAHIPEELFWIIGRAQQIQTWAKTHQFCGQCGAKTTAHPDEHAMVCPSCDFRAYPRVQPAVIMSITKGNEILLAHNHKYKSAMFSVLAGFVESGESLEECVIREIKEEVGITVKNVTYFGSQPWPFPSGLMVAFTTEYESGEIVLQEEEIAEANWYTADALPLIPSRPSISYDLIKNFIDSQSL